MKFAKVPRFVSDVLGADIVLRRHYGTANGRQFSASARLALPGQDIYATATHADLYTAVVKLVATLARLSRKRSTRLRRLTRSAEHASSANSVPISPTTAAGADIWKPCVLWEKSVRKFPPELETLRFQGTRGLKIRAHAPIWEQ
jgi:ribosome-associated translation inhibitor RaiA